jgi:catechol 2,3-dioxygenase
MAVEYGIRAPEYRLPDRTHIGRVRLQVSDLARSVEYYLEIIGLKLQHRDEGIATLGAGNDDAPILQLHERRGARPVARHGRLGLYHFAILLPDRADLGEFVSHLADTSVRAASADHRVSEALYLWDPDGLGIEVYADRPRAQWQVNGAELLMTTEPLDVRDLVRAAKARAWSGLPPGTTIGHVHLHVGSLERAEALYHAALGFDKVVWSYPGALFMSAGGYHHHLGINTWAAGSPPAADNDARLLDWELVVPTLDDVEAVGASLAAARHRTTTEGADRIVTDDWGTSLRVTARS